MLLHSFANPAAWRGAPPPIYPTASQWADSVANDAQVIQSVTAIRTNSHARLTINVPAGTTSLTAWLANNLFGATFEVGVGVYVDGVYNTSWNPAAGASAALTPFTLALDGSAHTVQIWQGYFQQLQGTYLYAIQGQGISIATPPNPTDWKLAIYGDSIVEGGQSTPSAQKSWTAQLRTVRPDGISQEAWGARQLWDDSGSGSGQMGFATPALWAARMAALVAGAASRNVWLAIGINDIGAGHWTAGQFQTNYSNSLAALNAADPGIHIYAQSMLTAQGAWTTAIQTAAAGASNCTYVDGTTMFNATAGFLGTDGVHPNNNGHQAYALGTGPAAGGTCVRAVLGI